MSSGSITIINGDMLNLKYFLITAFFLAFPFPARAAAYYVSNSGSDSNSGSRSQPFKTIQKAATGIMSGDTVYVRAGIYQEKVSINKSGSSSSPTVFTSYQGETAVIDGSNLTFSNIYVPLVNINGSYIVFKNFELKNSKGRGIQVGGSKNHIFGNNVHHSWKNGIYVTGSGNIVENNRVWRAAECNFCVGAQTRMCNGDWGGALVWGAAHSPNVFPDTVIKNI